MTKIQKTAQRVVSLIFDKLKQKDLFDDKGNLRKSLIKVGVESHRFYPDQPTSYNVYVRVDGKSRPSIVGSSGRVLKTWPKRYGKEPLVRKEYVWTVGSWDRWGGLQDQTETQAKKGALAWARKLAGEIKKGAWVERSFLRGWQKGTKGAVKILKTVRRTLRDDFRSDV